MQLRIQKYFFILNKLFMRVNCGRCGKIRLFDWLMFGGLAKFTKCNGVGYCNRENLIEEKKRKKKLEWTTREVKKWGGGGGGGPGEVK